MRAVLIAALWMLVASGCASLDTRSDYQLLGGKPGISAIVEDTLVAAATDPEIAHHFQNASLVRLHEKLTELICVKVDGPCTYTGFPMPAAHAGRHIDAAAFNRYVELLIDAMEAHDVPRPTQNRVLRELAPMRSEVIYR